MANDPKKLSITYSSGLIPPSDLMSTLAVFYDEIWLLNPYGLNPANNVPFRVLGEQYDIMLNSAQKQRIQDNYLQQLNRWERLFRYSILQILPPLSPDRRAEIDEQVIRGYEEEPSVSKYPDLRIDAFWYHLFADKPSPELFISEPSDTSTSRLAGYLVRSLFDYKVPQLQALNAEQILEVRDYLKDTKEGFTHYIFEMTDDVERRIREHNLSDIEATQKTFERKIQPQYEEFRRKLAAKKTGFWSKVAVAGGKFIQVDAAPWTPKFWGAVLEMCSVSLDEFSKAEQENFLSNKNQAFNYIATLEDRVSRI